jgi:Polyketide cyclase / dehydrase and lipid transport
VAEVQGRRRIRASQRHIWKVLCDLERFGEWGAWTLYSRRVDRPAGLGAAYDERSRLLLPVRTDNRWRIIEFDPPRRQVHRVESAPLIAVFDRVFELRDEGAEATEVTVTLEYAPRLGPLGRALDHLAWRRVQSRRLDAILDAIERIATQPAG